MGLVFQLAPKNMANSTLGEGRRDRFRAGQYKLRIGKYTNLLTVLVIETQKTAT